MRFPAPLAGLACAACMVPGSSAAYAQRAANLSTRDIPPAEQARDTMNRFAACVVKARPTMVQRALAAPAGAERFTALNEVVKRECLADGMLRMDPRLFEGGLYRALYLREFGRSSDAAVASAVGEAIASDNPLLTFGDCVARAAPAATHAFLSAEPSTSQERAALAELGPVFGACIPATEQIAFTPAALQAVLAQALYKRVAARAAEQEVAG